MEEYKVKLNSVMSLHPELEQPLIDHLEDLKSQHKMGDFITACVRIVWENPGLLAEHGYNMVDLEGITLKQTRFNNDINKRIKEVRSTANDIYSIAYKCYMLSLFGKRMGIEGKSKDLLRASFMVQMQSSLLASALGVSNLGHSWVNKELEITEKHAEEMLEYILESYEGIVGELKESIVTQVVGGNSITTRNEVEKTEGSEVTSISNTKIERSNKNDTDVYSKEEQKIEINRTGAEEEVVFQAEDNWDMLNALAGD